MKERRKERRKDLHMSSAMIQYQEHFPLTLGYWFYRCGWSSTNYREARWHNIQNVPASYSTLWSCLPTFITTTSSWRTSIYIRYHDLGDGTTSSSRQQAEWPRALLQKIRTFWGFSNFLAAERPVAHHTNIFFLRSTLRNFLSY
jgi:hypothetical protein